MKFCSYGDLVQGNVTIKRVYYIKGLNDNLFFVGQFFDADLDVAFRKSTCFVRDIQGNELLTGTRGSDLYIIALQESSSPTSIYFIAKASPYTKPTLNVQPTLEIIPPTYVNAKENNTDQVEDEPFEAYEFINPFDLSRTEAANSSTCSIDTSNMHTFYQIQRFDYHWTKDHPREQVCRNPSKPVQTRRHLATDPKMRMFVLTVSKAKPKNIKEEMADRAWIEAMQEELH
nr:Gag-Pol polyprotein [Tanacetum cinerariifolium]